jgi:hypothetical protein
MTKFTTMTTKMTNFKIKLIYGGTTVLCDKGKCQVKNKVIN